MYRLMARLYEAKRADNYFSGKQVTVHSLTHTTALPQQMLLIVLV